MNISKLEQVLEKEPKYRLAQARQAIFKKFISDWSEASFFSNELRQKLNKECPLEIDAEVLVSKDKESAKARITLKDGFKIETALMRHKDGRNTVCVSSQVGCPLGCLFCATGKMGLKRNLTAQEIIEQVIFFNRYLKKVGPSEARGVTNVTYMGMGEPFLNYDNVLESIKILNNKDYFNIGSRLISVSTSGIIEGIEKFSKEGIQTNLAISLHAPNNELRSRLMPISKKYSLKNVLKAVDDYIEETNRKVMFEYILIDGVNDSDLCAKELANLMSAQGGSASGGKNKLYFVNLILYNAVSGSAGQMGILKPSKTERVEKFKEILKKEKVNFVQRYRFGDDIQAACGQFSTNK